MSELKLLSEERQIETTRVSILGKDTEIILPKTKFVKEYGGYKYYVDFPLSPYDHNIGFIESREFNGAMTGHYHNLYKNGFRHIALAELAQILSKQSDISDKIYHRIMEALVMSNGYSTCSDVGTGHWGIYVDDGIRVEDKEATIFKGISGKLKWYEGKILNPMWNSSYHLGKSYIVPNERFCIKRLFRKKLQDEIKERPLMLQDLYDASPDLIEYLFEQEFSDLPKDIQNMAVNFPLGNKEERGHEKERGLFVMPMAMIYHTHIFFEKTKGMTADYYKTIEGFRIKPDRLSMPANYCNSVLPARMHHWGVKGSR